MVFGAEGERGGRCMGEQTQEGRIVQYPGQQEENGTGKKTAFIVIACLVLISAAAVGAVIYAKRPSRGYQDYKVQMQQYFSEYTDRYEYSEVVTVTYPQIEGIEEERQKRINQMLYDTAMDRTNYWHLEPDDYVSGIQQEYSIFSSDASCEVSYHSQYLLSLNYEETYAPVNPVFYVSITKRGLNVDLMTGEQYGLGDIVRIDDAFIKFWTDKANKEYDDFFGDSEEDREILLSWFLGGDEEWNEYYEFHPYFYVREGKDFMMGIAIDPKYVSSARPPQEDAYEIVCSAKELEKFKTKSDFWEKYDLSENAGEIVECGEMQENIWLEDLSGAGDYWERIEGLY